MISLEQIRSLESKVHTAVSRIRALSEENATMKQRLENYEERIAELQTLVAAFKADQDEIEAGIVSALQHLDALEDSITEPSPTAPQPAPDEAPAPESVESGSASAEPEAEPATPPAETPDTPVPETTAELSPESSEEEEATDENTTPDEDEEPELDIF